jgi:pantoate--beta-alanine ligase
VKIVRTIAELRARPRGLLGLVTTMGAFHEGHLALFRAAREENDRVVASLFVNPAQFAADEDLATYPRDEERDARLAEEAGVDVLFIPAPDELYPPDFQTWVEVEGLGRRLEGEQRPGHFRGVATVCLKLFNIVRPRLAYFGQKDAQQALVIRKMARDLDMPVDIEVLPTVRDPDGLALSSRNAYLSAEERERALALSRALRAADATVSHGTRDAGAVLAAARGELDAAGVQPDYLELLRADDLSPAERVNGRTLLAVAARIGRARLIDNTILGAGT